MLDRKAPSESNTKDNATTKNDDASSMTPINSTNTESEASPPLPILDLKIQDIEGIGPTTARKLKESGIVSATTCEPGFASVSADRLLLPRVLDNPLLSPIEFEGWLSGVSAALPRRR